MLLHWFVSLTFTLLSCDISSKEIRIKRPFGWEQKSGPDGTIAVKKGDIFNTTLIVKKYKLSRPIKWTESKLTKKVNQIQKLRSRFLSFAGIKNWKIDTYKFLIQNSSRKTLIFQGHYVGISNQNVQFYELNVYDGEEHFQITYTQDRNQGLNLEEAKDLLKELRVTN